MLADLKEQVQGGVWGKGQVTSGLHTPVAISLIVVAGVPPRLLGECCDALALAGGRGAPGPGPGEGAVLQGPRKH